MRDSGQAQEKEIHSTRPDAKELEAHVVKKISLSQPHPPGGNISPSLAENLLPLFLALCGDHGADCWQLKNRALG